MPSPVLSPARWVPVVPVALLLLVALSPPLLGEAARDAVMHAFSRVCHQMPSRSFAFGGTQVALCHRCTGIAMGLLGAALLLPWAGGIARRISDAAPLALTLGALPIALDWGGDALGWWTNTAGSRLVTGLVCGLVVGALLARALRQLALRKAAP